MIEGLIAVALLVGTYAYLGATPSVALLAAGFCGTVLVYQVERGLGVAPEDVFSHPLRAAWMRRHRGVLLVTAALALVGALAAAAQLRGATLAWGAALAVLGLVYALPLLPGGRRLKTFWYAKSVAVGGAWAVSVVVVPAVETGGAVGGGLAWLLVARFLFVLANTWIADGADRAGDARAGLRTAATMLPPGRLRRLAAVAAVGAAVATLPAALAPGAPRLFWIDAAGPLLLAALALRPSLRPSSPGAQVLAADLLVAWPAVTVAVVWAAGG